MNYPYDLQSHSFFSDGDESPEELAQRAKTEGLLGLILTDHNTILGYERFKKTCQSINLETIPGVEITARYENLEIHVLGYSFNFKNNLLQEALITTVNGYNKRSKQIVENCKKTGLADLDFTQLLSQRPADTYVTKYDIVKALAQTTGQSKKDLGKLLNAGGKLHVPYGDWAMTPQQAVEIIHQANGVAILAHPGESKKRFAGDNKAQAISTMDKLIYELINMGLDGLEARHISHTPAEEDKYIKIALDHKLIITGSSDWHGPYHHPDQKLGTAGLNQSEWQEFISLIKRKTHDNK
ncbi:MAG: PHP domain-containing protein [Patescibacteria group bacterium]